VAGKVRSIGVSNFSEIKLEEILPTAEIFPAVNQANFLSPLDDRPLSSD
jgi:diketogulonate reductase-like aldo/keto reductase